MLILYANPRKPQHGENVKWFKEIIAEFPEVRFFNPNPVAPWHVKATVNFVDMNFWPCAGKANTGTERAVYGYSAVRNLIERALEEEDFDVLEPSDTNGGFSFE